MIQRYLSLPSLRAARKALILFLVGTTVVLSLCCYNGLLIYAMHHDCDPLSTGLAKAKDQLVPLLVMEVLAIYPGLAGLFVAGIFSAALSSLSTALNSLSAIVLEDFCKPFVKQPLTEMQVRYLMRGAVLIFGALAVVLVVVVEKMGAVLQLSMSLGPVTLGPLFGLFIMGMFFPRINGTYLQMRFDKRMRVFGSVLFMVACLLWMPVVIYVPALAFNQVTGINVHTITPIVCLICIFYTSAGGMKAVVWTDVIQSAVTLGAILVVLIKGVIDVGGPAVVWERNMAGKRLEAPNFDPNPTIRHSVWTMMIGGSVWYTYGVSCSQDMIQRYLSLPTLDDARKASRGFVFGMILVIVLLSSIGMLIFATYHDCDPLTTNLAAAKDQLLPLFVMDIFQNYPGAAGVFVAGIFSAALSSLSSALNALAAITFEDFVKPYFGDRLTEKHIAYTLRGSVLIFGVISVIFIYIVEHLGAVMQLTMTLSSTSGGPLFGLFVMGILMPWVNATGALYGGITGFLSMCYLCFRSQASLATGEIIYSTKDVDVSGCTYQYTNTSKPAPTFDDLEKSLHHISYQYFTLFGTIISCTVGSLVSIIRRSTNRVPIDPKLVAPFIRRFIARETKTPEKYPLNEIIKDECTNSNIHQPE